MFFTKANFILFFGTMFVSLAVFAAIIGYGLLIGGADWPVPPLR